ncbi:membrane protein [Spirochaetia bacterium]|nr:membrane protein [Spirochaetia bacterium]
MVTPKLRKVTTTSVLSGVILVLGITNLDFIPLPFLAYVTVLHIPVIIGAILEGPLVGMFIGVVFGIFSIIKSGLIGITPIDLAFIHYPAIALVPRVLIGPAAWGVYTLIMRIFVKKDEAMVYTPKIVTAESIAIAAATIIGSFVNTTLVLSLLVFFVAEVTKEMAIAVFISNGPLEAIAAAIITLSVVSAWKHIPRGGGKAKLHKEGK